MLFTKEIPKEDGVYWATHIWAYTSPDVLMYEFEPFLVKIKHFSLEDVGQALEQFKAVIQDYDVTITNAFGSDDDSDYSPMHLMYGDSVEIPKVDNYIEQVASEKIVKFIVQG